MAWLRVRGVRDRRIFSAHRRLAAHTTMRSELVLDALEQAGSERATEAGLIHHSDRGQQYLSMRYTERLAEAGIAPSVGSRGDAYDNALAESVIGLYKTDNRVSGKPGAIHHKYGSHVWGIMPSSEKQDAAEELAKLLAESATATALWPTEADRRAVAERVAERYRPDPERGKWRVQAFAHDPTSTKLFVVKRAEHDVYSDPLEAKAKAVASALNALEERRWRDTPD